MSSAALVLALIAATGPLRAETTISLDGTCAVKVQLEAAPAGLVVQLPGSARDLVLRDGEGRTVEATRAGERVTVKRAATRLVLSYFDRVAPFSLRGRYRAVLPRFDTTLSDVRWTVTLPRGLSYGAPQASLELADDCEDPTCVKLGRAELRPSAEAFVEGAYTQRL